MDARLKDRIAVITGASRGIGQAIAFKFANAGARIVCADFKSGGTEEEINNKHGKDRATFVKCDVTNAEEVEHLISESVKFGGRVDIMCNFAGIIGNEGVSARVHEIEVEAFDKTIAVNTRGVWLCCKYALKQMLEQEPREANYRGDRTRGWIVNAASIYGLTAVAGASPYVTSKHAVVGMTRQMAVDYSADRIHVNCVCPGWIHTKFIPQDPETIEFAKSLHPWGEIGTAEDVANAALFLASDDAAWVSGSAMVLDGGYTAK